MVFVLTSYWSFSAESLLLKLLCCLKTLNSDCKDRKVNHRHQYIYTSMYIHSMGLMKTINFQCVLL